MAAKRQHTAHSHSLLTVSYGPLYNFSTVIQCKKKKFNTLRFSTKLERFSPKPSKAAFSLNHQ